MINNLPIYRAKKIDSDEYVEGFYVDTVDFLTKTLKNTNGYITKNGSFHIVDISTLSIHFPDMLAKDSNRHLPNGEKDLRIFASLQKNGKGGDIVKYSDYIERYTMLFSSFSGTRAVSFDLKLKSRINAGLKIVGIQE